MPGQVLLEMIPEEAIQAGVSAADWRAALRACGEIMVKTGLVDLPYIDQMIAAVEDLGPYMVIAPGIALAHARPSPAVRRPGFSIVVLDAPVSFGHPENDPVRLIIGLAAPDPHSHVQALAAIAEMLSDESCRSALFQAKSRRDVLHVLTEFSERGSCA
ncbi:MAG: PTS sugar transporter subunit IIA [Thermoflexus sp.]|jgi:PTS system ascorbate-specific IIA component|nr:PTS sugar transporter subunit IIA [Thermoflexus sp.]